MRRALKLWDIVGRLGEVSYFKDCGCNPVIQLGAKGHFFKTLLLFAIKELALKLGLVFCRLDFPESKMFEPT